MTEWKLWSEERPTDNKALYRWRVSERKILGMMLRPEWSEKLHLCGMGFSDSEYWPTFSDWNGYTRSVDPSLEWRLAAPQEAENNIYWGGLDLLPCPFTGATPVVIYMGKFIGAPPYRPEWLGIKSHMVSSLGWASAEAMRTAWNTRP